jgi:predicted regulator of Ras-like GTPase activity (Roadblock/LC7/MglB family)
MTSIKLALEKLNKRPGVAGSLVCGRDGMIIETALGERFNGEVLAAMASSVDIAIVNACAAVKFHRYTRYQVVSNNGQMIITDLGRFLFVVILEANANLPQINVEIFQASNEIKKNANIG